MKILASFETCHVCFGIGTVHHVDYSTWGLDSSRRCSTCLGLGILPSPPEVSRAAERELERRRNHVRTDLPAYGTILAFPSR